jgi:holo-[acyl-carrier protein] synthase
MIVGIGTDVIETERMRNAIVRYGDRFLSHVFTPTEIADAPTGPARDGYFAARWADKEAVSKALGTGIGAECAWTDITVRRGPAGEPLVDLTGSAHSSARRRGIDRIHVSLSHERNLAAAMVVAEHLPPTASATHSPTGPDPTL